MIMQRLVDYAHLRPDRIYLMSGAEVNNYGGQMSSVISDGTLVKWVIQLEYDFDVLGFRYEIPSYRNIYVLAVLFH